MPLPHYQKGVTINVLSTGAITKHRFVSYAGVESGAGVKSIGVSEVSVDSGEMCPVIVTGTCVIEASAAIAVGAAIKAAATGKAVTDAASPNVIGVTRGFALTAANADGDLIEMLLAV